MFIGHFAVGLTAKKFAPQANLGLLFLACQLLDLVWPVLVILGVEKVSVDLNATAVTPLNFEHYPYSHSLFMAAIYSLILAAAVRWTWNSWRAGLVVGFVVLSHWLLDFASHRADLPILLGSEKYGLGLWNSLGATLVVEVGMFIAGIYFYVKAKGTALQHGWFWSLIGFLLLIYAMNIIGPKPPIDTKPAAIAAPALAMWLLVLWAFRADRAPQTVT